MTTSTPQHLIGRDHEVERVALAINERRPILIVGEPGVGKTALARASVAVAGVAPVWEGGGITTLDWVSYLPFRRALGLPLPDGDASVVADFVADHADGGAFIVDDLQWVDEDTVTAAILLGDLAPVVAIARPMPRGHDIRRRVTEARFEVVELSQLDDHAAAQLAVANNPALTPAAAASVARRARGNPLLIQGLAYADEDTTELALAMRARLAELSPTARKALHRVAILERPTPLGLAGDDLQQLLDMALVARTPEGVQVRHALIAEAVLDGVSPDHLRSLHRAVAQHIDDPGEAARHWAAAGDLARARELALMAAETAGRDVERARCAALAATCNHGPDRDTEIITAAQRLAALGDFPGVLDLAPTVPAGSPHEPEALRLAARARFETHRPDDAEAALTAGLTAAARLQDEPSEARLRVTTDYHDLVSMKMCSETTLRNFKRAQWHGVADAEIHVQAAAVLASLALEEGVALARRGRELAGVEPNPWAEQESWATEAIALNNLARWDEALQATQQGEAELRAQGRHTHLARVQVARADQLAWECDYDTVLDLTAELLERPALLGGHWDIAITSRGLALSDTGHPDDADTLLAQLDSETRHFVAYGLAWVRAEALLTRGDGWGAMRAAQTAAELLTDPLWRPQTIAALVRAQWECGVPVVEPAGLLDIPVNTAHLAEIGGLVALQQGDAARAVDRFRHALSDGGWRRYKLRYQLGLAEALDLIDPEAATTEFRALADELREVGFTTLLHRVEPLLHATPGGRRLRATPPPTATPVAGLTPREHEILSLVSDGLTSRAIAQRLAITQPTVESHIRSAMRKLGARTRTEAAAALRAPGAHA